MKHFFAIILFFSAVVFISCSDDSDKKRRLSQVQSTGIETFLEGEEIPSLVLSDINDREYDIHILAGDRLLLLNVWASWCAPCVKELPSLQELHEALHEEGLRVITINIDPPGSEDQVQKLIRKMKLDLLVLRDPDLLSVEKFRISGFPETFIISDGKFCAIDDPVSARRSIRIRGDREWSSAGMREVIRRELLEKQ